MYTSLIIPSPLWDLVGIADEKSLFVLEFSDSSRLKDRLMSYDCMVWQVGNSILSKTHRELDEYFLWKRKIFSIPLSPEWTVFQKQSWDALRKIPYGETRSYKEEAIMAGKGKAIRAIGWANNKNPIVIIIPCHRVIGASGELIGYGWGIERKKWLLEHENRYNIATV